MKIWKIYSESLRMKMEIQEISPGIYAARAEDGTVYTSSELKALSGTKTPPQVHVIKKVFKGTVIECR